MLLVAGAMFLGTGSTACHARLPRLSEQGRHEEVVTRAGKARILPRKRAARAWARSLVALGRSDEARAVLLRDFRKHAELPSLIALADLEAAEGRLGLATAHYARAASLESDPLAGRADVCELFRRRAARFFAEGEALAADLDLRRVAMICPKGKGAVEEAQWRADRALHEQVIAAAKVQARAQRSLPGCEGERCRTPGVGARSEALAEALSHARAAGPAALREAAGRLRVQLEVEDVAELLAAELRGELGLDLVDLDELRGWIGESAASEVVAAADSRLSPLARDYVRLRLAQLGPGYELPGEDAAQSTASTVIRMLEAADDDPGAAAMSWRVFVLLGDLASAEMALGRSLGGRAAPTRAAAADGGTEGAPRAMRLLASPPAGSAGAKGMSQGAGAGASGAAADRAVSQDMSSGAPAAEDASSGADGDEGPSQRLVPPPKLWSARAAVDAATLPRLLQLARLRGAAGRRDQALAIAAWALAEGQARGIPVSVELAAAEARHELAAGRPWSALALASVVRGGPTEDVVRAAGSAIVLERAACGERCGDADDRVAVEQVLGEAWLVEQERRAIEAAHARVAAARRESACPLLAESLAPDASGLLSAALRRARTEGLGAPGLGEELRRVIESDLTLDCAGRVAVPLMYAADTRVAAAALADSLAHAPQEVAAGQLALQSELALVLGRRDHADSLAQAAAAASPEPREVWRRAARMARWIDARHYELLALRQLLLHGVEAAEADEVRLRLTVRALRDADDAWAPRNAEAGREALIRGVESFLADVPPARRWHAREALALALAEYEWADEQAAALVRAAVWPDEATARAHPAAFRRLERALGSETPGAVQPLAPAELAAELAAVTPLGAAGSLEVSEGAGPAGRRRAAGAARKAPNQRSGAEGPAVTLPAEAEAFCSVDSLQAARLAALRRTSGAARVRVAAALATTGDAATRREALRLLVAGLEPKRRTEALDAVIAGLSAVPGREAAPMLVSDEDLLAVVFNLARDSARRPREVKGEGG